MIETLVIDSLRKTVVPEARRWEGVFLVEYGGPFKAVAVVSWFVTLGIIVLCFHPSTTIEPQATAFIVGGFLLLALFLHSEFYFVRISYSTTGITVYSRWGGERKIAWKEINSVTFSKSGQNYLVKLTSGRQFTFNYFMSGYQSLLNEVQKRAGVILNSGQPDAR